MSVNVRVLVESLAAAAAETTQYTAPAATKTIIDKFTGTNTSGAGVVMTVKLVPSGGAVGVGNTIVVKNLAAGECYTFPELVGHVLSAGDFISTLLSVGAVVAVRASGREVS